MTPDTATSSTSKICPTCGTRLSENATRCLVCGRTFASEAKSDKPDRSVQGPRIPEVTLSLPIALGFIVLLIGIGAAVVFFLVRSKPSTVIDMTATPTATRTPTLTLTPTETATFTPTSTATLLPPKEYQVKAGDTCGGISVLFGISYQLIVQENNLDANCTLRPGMILKIPQLTPTPPPQSTSTISAAQATDKACDVLKYQVKEGDTLGSISANYNIPLETIMADNGMSNDVVYSGMFLNLSLCKRRPTAGPTPTPTPPPPYGPPNLLLPADGAAFTTSGDVITLQWSAVGTLRSNEAYQISIEDITDGTGRKLVDTVTDTKYIVPSDFRPSTSSPHVMRWSVVAVRQTGTDAAGKPIWDTSGAESTPRVFVWVGGGTSAPTPTP